MFRTATIEWSKSYLCPPKDHFISHVLIKSKPFVPSYEHQSIPVSMNLLLGWEYGRCWIKERNAYIAARKMRTAPKYIENDYHNWILKRTPKEKRKTCLN